MVLIPPSHDLSLDVTVPFDLDNDCNIVLGRPTHRPAPIEYDKASSTMW
jgi:hypothetical protein